MIISKITLLLFITVVPVEAIVENKLFKKDDIHTNIICPFASLDLGLFKKVSGCAAMCSSAATCKGFFYNKQQQFCKGATDVLSTTFGCEDMPGTVYYQTTVMRGEYGDMCSMDVNCTRDASACLQGTCLCQAGYRYEPSTGACVINCTSYGSTYIEYRLMLLSVVAFAEYLEVTLSQCQAYCSGSDICRGFNYKMSTGTCKLKDLTPYTNPGDFKSYSLAHYYTRNCA